MTQPQHSESHIHPHNTASLWGMVIGSIGVVFGDIGTSPLYAMREALIHVSPNGFVQEEVIGIVSLLLWSLVIVVTLKYVVILMQADNRGEGGTLSLMALAQKALGNGRKAVFLMGIAGAALFYGDAAITPAISVLSAVEGLKLVTPVFEPYVIPITITVIVALFLVQSRGTRKVAIFFGPIMTLWFIAIGLLGIMHIADDFRILHAFNPLKAAFFLANHGIVGLIVLGSVFLAVTGGEALYADMGHFGRKPIRMGWMLLVLPSLALNYLGQGALMLTQPHAIENPFFYLAPDWFLLPLVLMATAATVIASQSVITGAYSLTHQAIQLGLLPRLEVRHTSETTVGQIYLPRVNRLLMFGVIFLVILFKTSGALATAYGIAVTGTMVVASILLFTVVRYSWKWSLPATIALVLPFFVIDMVFFGANMLKLLDGGYVPLLFAIGAMLLMWTWMRGSRILAEKEARDSIPLEGLVKMLKSHPPHRVQGTAVFLTSDPHHAPSALMHNLKHNKVLHEHIFILNVRTANIPVVDPADRSTIEDIDGQFKIISLVFGYMETPNIPIVMAALRKAGLEFEIMSTSFFLGRRTIKPSVDGGMPYWQDLLYIWLAKNATRATDFYHIPSGRVVELGQQVVL